jgi:hypothetical protein
MQIKQKFGDYEIEILKAPFGKNEPIGLLFEGNGKKICWHDFTWDQINKICGLLRENKEYIHEDRKMFWDGNVFVVKNGEEEFQIPMEKMKSEFWQTELPLDILFYYRSIDPY